MSMCGDCHDEIDKNEALYPAPKLIEMKREHEERIRYLTELAPEGRTTLLILRGQIADRPVDISFDEMRDAVAPMYPIDRKGHIIDVTNLGDDRAPDYFETAARVIKSGMKDFYARRIDGTAPRHVSVFALASIPLLVLFGRHVSDKIQVQFFQRHRDGTKPWKWQEDSLEPLAFDSELVRDGRDSNRVGVILSISGRIERNTLPADIINAGSCICFLQYPRQWRSHAVMKDSRKSNPCYASMTTSHRPTAQKSSCCA
ncbi:MAG: SAVED domain-containing protein [Rhodomicrobium sp.]